MLMKRPDEPASGSTGEGKWPDEVWVKKYPVLCEHLGDERWEDGTPREPSTLGIKSEEGRIVVSVNDKELNRSLYRSGGTVDEALKAIEKAIIDPKADWRYWSGKGGRKKK